VYLPIEELQKRLYPDEVWPAADQVHIKLAAGVPVDSALAQIRGVWEVFASEQLGWNRYLIKYTDIETAAQMQSRYVAALVTQMGVLLLIFGVVSLGVVLLVFCIFYMIVRLKQKDVAILKSCGAASGSVVLVFGGFGACVGLIGSALGAILGYVVTRNVNTIEAWIRVVFGLKLWKSSVYMFSRIPNEVNWSSALIIVLSAIFAVVLGALMPAIIAARTRPVNVLRYE
jgi:lipoprotein-releasing system permease protein